MRRPLAFQSVVVVKGLTSGLASFVVRIRVLQGVQSGTAIGLVLLALMVGCATAQLPISYVVDAQAAISAAESVGAEKIPKAQLHLKMARDQVKKADLYIKEKEPEKARFMLMRAQADAEVALALTREAQDRARLEEANKRVDELIEAEEDRAEQLVDRSTANKS